MATRVKLNTWRQAIRLGLGLLVVAALAAMFAYAALVTADSTAKQVGAWVCCGLFVVFGGLVAIGGAHALHRQYLVVSSEGIAREAAAQPWQVGWDELNTVSVETSYRFVQGRYSLLPARFRLKNWRVVVRLSVKDPAAFAARHEVLKVYRGRFGASADEWGLWFGPEREIVAPLDEGLRSYGGGVYQGIGEHGVAPAGLFAPTGATRRVRNRST